MNVNEILVLLIFILLSYFVMAKSLEKLENLEIESKKGGKIPIGISIKSYLPLLQAFFFLFPTTIALIVYSIVHSTYSSLFKTWRLLIIVNGVIIFIFIVVLFLHFRVEDNIKKRIEDNIKKNIKESLEEELKNSSIIRLEEELKKCLEKEENLEKDMITFNNRLRPIEYKIKKFEKNFKEIKDDIEETRS